MPYESNLWTWLKDNTRIMRTRDELDLCRIETSTTVGYPDVEGCLRGRNFHIELKGTKRPKRESTKINVGISKEQVIWLEKRWRTGGACSVLIRVGFRNDIKRYLVSGRNARQLLKPVKESVLDDLSEIFTDATAPRTIEMAAKCHAYIKSTP